MAIQISPNGRLMTIQTNDSSYQMLADKNGVLLHLYYGSSIGAEDLSDLIVRSDVGFSGNPEEAGMDRTYSLDTLPQEVASSGVGDFRDDSVRLTHPDGSCAADFRFESCEVVSGAYSIPGMPALYDTDKKNSETLIIKMKEKASGAILHLYYGVWEEENVITRTASLTNAGKEPIYIEKFLSCSMDMMDRDLDLISFTGRHAMERTMERTPVTHIKTEFGSIRGTSSHHYNPAMILCDRHATEDAGDCFGLCLAYSGNFTAMAQKDQRDQIRVQMGINPYQFRWCLTEGETFFAPQVILSFSNQGFSKLSHQYHDILHEHMCRGRYKHERRPVLINNWEATYFDFNEEKIEKIAAQAGELGIEMMVLDDGWFGKRDDDNSGLGDWFVNEKKIRGGLPKLSEKIHEKGMKFGLWFEPEMISEDSDLYRAHPDWAITIPGRVPNHSRNQLVLDMTRSDVRDYLMARFEEILGNTKIEYVKWDMNRSICDMYSHIYKGEQSGECYHRYILGVYDLLERFVQRFPEILLEGCSGGGGRFDAGMLYYSPQIWCSDNTDAMNRLDIQYGTSFFYPISSVGAHVSACPNHQTGRSVPLSTRADVALAGSFGYELDLRLLSDEEKAQVKEQIKEFHDYYDLTHEGDYYRLTERDNTSFTAWEFVAKNKERALVEVVKKDAWGNPLPVHVAIKGLEDNSMYVCSLNGIKRSGKTWNHAGITLPKFLSAGESMKFTFMKVE